MAANVRVEVDGEGLRVRDWLGVTWSVPWERVVGLALLREQVLPRSDDATYVSGFFRFFKAEFAVLRNIDTYDLSEDYQMGPVLQVGVRWAIRIAALLASDRHDVGSLGGER